MIDTMTADIIKGQKEYSLPSEMVYIKTMKVNGIKTKIPYPIYNNLLILKETPSRDIIDGLKINAFRLG